MPDCSLNLALITDHLPAQRRATRRLVARSGAATNRFKKSAKRLGSTVMRAAEEAVFFMSIADIADAVPRRGDDPK